MTEQRTCIRNGFAKTETTELDKELWYCVFGLSRMMFEKGFPKYLYSGAIFDCHSIVRGIAGHVQKLDVQSGYYYGVEVGPDEGVVTTMKMDHSWLRTPDGAIIDPYPGGFFTHQPILVPTKGHLAPFGGNLYRFDQDVFETHSTSLKVLVHAREVFEILDHGIAEYRAECERMTTQPES